jgi:hypothetical protein
MKKKIVRVNNQGQEQSKASKFKTTAATVPDSPGNGRSLR